MRFKTDIVPHDELASFLNDYTHNNTVEVIHSVDCNYGPYSDKCLAVTVKLTPKPKSTKFRRNLRGK